MKFEVPSFTDSKDMIKAKIYKNGLRDTDHAHWGSLSSQGYHLIYSTCIQNLVTLALAVTEIWLQASKLKIGHVTLTMPLLKVICRPYAETWYSLPVYKI